eukprot:sb/3468588/
MTSSARNKSSEVSAIEYSTVRVPYDVLNKKFRHAQKIIDREISQLNSLISNIERLPSPELEEQAIKSLREKLGSFKKRYLDCLSKEGGYANKCSERLDYLQEYIDESDAKIESLWKKKRLNRILVDYFLRNSNYETAVQLVKATGIEVNLEFKLHTQNFIEKIRAGDYKGAIQYAQRYLVDGGEAPLKLQETMALLAFKPTTEVMNEHNHPLMLPNGHVYGERALTEMMETEGVIVCPRTEEVFWLDQCKKVYVM